MSYSSNEYRSYVLRDEPMQYYQSPWRWISTYIDGILRYERPYWFHNGIWYEDAEDDEYFEYRDDGRLFRSYRITSGTAVDQVLHFYDGIERPIPGDNLVFDASLAPNAAGFCEICYFDRIYQIKVYDSEGKIVSITGQQTLPTQYGNRSVAEILHNQRFDRIRFSSLGDPRVHIQEFAYEDIPVVFRYEYHYDSRTNWTERSVYRESAGQSELIYLSTRQLFYRG